MQTDTRPGREKDHREWKQNCITSSVSSKRFVETCNLIVRAMENCQLLIYIVRTAHEANFFSD